MTPSQIDRKKRKRQASQRKRAELQERKSILNIRLGDTDCLPDPLRKMYADGLTLTRKNLGKNMLQFFKDGIMGKDFRYVGALMNYWLGQSGHLCTEIAVLPEIDVTRNRTLEVVINFKRHLWTRKLGGQKFWESDKTFQGHKLYWSGHAIDRLWERIPGYKDGYTTQLALYEVLGFNAVFKPWDQGFEVWGQTSPLMDHMGKDAQSDHVLFGYAVVGAKRVSPPLMTIKTFLSPGMDNTPQALCKRGNYLSTDAIYAAIESDDWSLIDKLNQQSPIVRHAVSSL